MTRFRIASFVGFMTVSLVLSSSSLFGQKTSVRPGVNESYEDPDVKQFVGRFEREGRDVFDRRNEVVQACGIRSGMDVADIGAGTGLFTRLFAKQVGPQGHVYAIDISPNFIQHIQTTAKQEGLENVVAVLGTAKSTKLPPDSIDLAFICDTYHHIEYPQQVVRSIHRALRPGGQLVLIDFRRIEGVTRPWVLDHVRAGQAVFSSEIVDVGFKQVDEKKDLLRDSYFVRFVKVEPDHGS